ncbi:Organic cation transporter protein, partial [Pseudolycoriella hygida]
MKNFFGIFGNNDRAPAHDTPPSPCNCSCGERNDATRIVGGQAAGINEFPWMARLSYFNRFYCGGMLINDRYVLTAAHCVKGFMWFMIKVTFGEHDRCNDSTRPETRFVLRAISQQFSFTNFDNDIAMLRLNDRVPITDFIRPICLPDNPDNLYVDEKAVATGWGTLKEDGKPSCILQEVEVPVLSNEICVKDTNYTDKMITDNMLCAGYPGVGKKDSCQGDSGGPLISQRADKRYELIGPLFILCTAPNILNGFHVSSYVFLGKMPTSYWCVIPELKSANWTTDQMRMISTKEHGLGDSCHVLNYNYSMLSHMNYNEALEYVQNNEVPEEISCLRSDRFYFDYFYNEGNSIVSEWDLVCENSFWRSTVQAAVSAGKFMGATSFGIISDKFGRKTAFSIGALVHIVGSILTTVSTWYWFFLIGRFMLGLATGALFYAAFALLTENIGIKPRSWMSIVITASYPIGMLLLALSANFLHFWRYLQLSLTIPAASLIFIVYYMKESPRWLLNKNREEEAYKIVFKTNKSIEQLPMKKDDNTAVEVKVEPSGSKLKNAFSEICGLYGSSQYRKLALICHFSFFVSSLSYYVTALNADNLSANRVVYVASTGFVDIFAYLCTIIILKFVGRKYSTFSLFAFSGLCLLSLLAIPRDGVTWIVSIAMFARFGITASYSVVTLHTAELFPTNLRSSALGTSSTIAHVGSISAPFVVDYLGKFAWYIPTTICGTTALLAGILAATLPETKQKTLDDKK